MAVRFCIRTFSSVVTLLLAVLAATAALPAQVQYEPQRYDPARGPAYDAPDYRAQDLPAFVATVDGYAQLERDGQSARDIENVPLEAGDRLRTTRGRVEILFDDGSTVALDEHTTVTLLSGADIELEAGRIRMQWRGRDRQSPLTIHTLPGRVEVASAGDYRVTVEPSRRGDAEIELAVIRGTAELANDQGRTLVRQGTRALTVAGYAPSIPYASVSPRDDFERWSTNQELDRYGVESIRYLPDELRYYGGVFDRYGSWQRHQTYGWVWYPRVSAGWRPYDGGRWSFVVGFGYSWVGGSRWSWPTHHYGQWDRIGARYFWVPARPTQRRVIGYAVPRPAYNVAVQYYSRPGVAGNTRVPPAQRGAPPSSARQPYPTPRATAPSQRPSSPPAQRAVPRSSTVGPVPPRSYSPTERTTPRAVPRNSTIVPRSAAPSSERPAPRPPTDRPSGRSPRAEPAAPPPTGSRTPTRPSETPRASGSSEDRRPTDARRPSGTAVRRGGGL